MAGGTRTALFVALGATSSYFLNGSRPAVFSRVALLFSLAGCCAVTHVMPRKSVPKDSKRLASVKRMICLWWFILLSHKWRKIRRRTLELILLCRRGRGCPGGR